MANIRISQLPTAPTAITGSELVPIVQNGQTVQTTVTKLVNSPVQTQTFATINTETSLPNSRKITGGLGIGVTDGGAQGNFVFALNATSASLENASTGIIAKTSGNTVAPITIQSSGSGISVTNGNGVSGNPTIALTGLNSILSTLSGTGLLAVAGGSSLSAITITGTANQIAVTNGSSSPVIGIVNNPVIPGGGSITIPTGGTASRPSSPANGMMRYNSDTNVIEGYINSSWQTISTAIIAGVTSFSAGTTGFTPNTSSTGVVTLAGTLTITNGGTGITTTPTNGQLLIGNGTNYTLSTLTSGVGITVTNASGSITISNTQTPGTIASASTITPTITTAQYNVTALAVGTTFAIPSVGADGQKLTIRIKDNGTAQTLAWTTTSGGYRIIGSTLPTTTVAGKVTYVGCVYNAQDTFWDVVAVTTQA